MKHILESQQFEKEMIDELFASATSLEGVREESLKGKILATLFYEPSTRTRLSFESAFVRMGGSVISMENAKEASSATKGETIEDTILAIASYVDVIVMRNSEEGSSAQAAVVSKVPIINAGDGSGQHPTQSLLDVYTIERELGAVDGIKIAMIGDLKYGRAVRSLSYLLGKYKDVSIVFVSSGELAMGEDVKSYLDKHAVSYEETDDLEAGIKDVDVVYMTRVQKERFSSEEEYEKQKGRFVLTRTHVDSLKDGAIVMHPLPRIDEIEVAVDDSPKAVYFKQVEYGLLMRMALLKYVLS